MNSLGKLAYVDTKLQGAADFYYAINATFRFIERRLGKTGLVAYWQDLGERYMAPVWKQWQQEGSAGIAAYWKHFFEAEPGAQVAVNVEGTGQEETVVLKVQRCPAIAHLREGKREVCPVYCQHCYFVSEAACAKAGYTMRVRGGNGSCEQRFMKKENPVEPQNLEEIKRC